MENNDILKSRDLTEVEHETLYFDIPLGNLGDDNEYMWKTTIVQLFKKNAYSRVVKYKSAKEIDGVKVSLERYAMTTNSRVIAEQIDWEKFGPMRVDKKYGWELGLDKDYLFSFQCENNEPNKHHERRLTYNFRDRWLDISDAYHFNKYRTHSVSDIMDGNDSVKLKHTAYVSDWKYFCEHEEDVYPIFVNDIKELIYRIENGE